VSLRIELLEAFETLFAEIRDEVRARIRSLAFAVSGDWRHVFRLGDWKEKIERLIRPIVEKFKISRRDKEAQIAKASEAAATYEKNISRAVEQAAEKANTVEQLTAIVDDSVWLDRASGWSEDMYWSLDQNEQLAGVAAQPAKYTLKRWVTQDDERVRQSPRADHVMMHNVVVPIDHQFQLITGLADFPGDPNLGVEDRANCRCYLIYE